MVSSQVTRRTNLPALLRGLLFDDAGHPMIRNPCDEERGSVSLLCLTALSSGNSQAAYWSDHPRSCRRHRSSVAQRRLGQPAFCPGEPPRSRNLSDHDMIAPSSRIEIRKNQLAFRITWLRPSPSDAANADQASDETSGLTGDPNATPLLIPWCKPPFRKAREILLPASVSRHQVRPLNAERRASLLKSIARGRQWLNEIVSGAVHDVEQLAQRHKCSVRHVNMTISMAFIAPSLVEAAVRRSSAARDWHR